MTTSALDIINGAAKKLGVLFKGEALPSDEANDGLLALNNMLDSWSNDDLITFALTNESFTLTGASSYTIGTGGNFNTSRPIDIASAVVRQGTIDYPLMVLSPQQYQQDIAMKSITGPIARFMVYDNNYPLATITLYPVDVAGATLRILSNKPLGNLSALTTTVDLPPGWKRALIYNLAIELSSEYGEEPSQSVAMNAKESLGAIKRSTSVNNPMPLMSEPVRQGNIFSGWYT